jgi:putative zinc- or iron-chelating protein
LGVSTGPEASAPELDISLLNGFAFTCLPGCGLCCFTSPRLDPGEERGIRAAAPQVSIVSRDGERRLAARPEGGACQFLIDLRCGVHQARPAPCREYPVSVHIGHRLQATVVLSCPGVSLEPLRSSGTPIAARPGLGLDAELASVRQRVTPVLARKVVEAGRRRRRIERDLRGQGRWVDEEEVRRTLSHQSLIPRPDEYSPQRLPESSEGLELLPMYYDGRAGPVALGEGFGGWEALELAAVGGATPLGLVVPPARPPTLDESAEALLSGYLRYWLARDCFLAAVQWEVMSGGEGTVLEATLADLHSIGSTVLARGSVRAKLRGDDGLRLSQDDIERGIRATDQDWLDRPTWGSRL